jgi:recombination protein RecA
MADERGKAIELAVSQIEKQFGKGSIMRLGSKEAIVPISVIRPERFRSTRRWA